jgi:hypothetical protein
MDLQSFIVQLVEKNSGEIAGRVRLQKLVYFCKALGADINTNYKLYIYGPFSQQVADTLQDCVLEDILLEENGIIREGTEFNAYMESSEILNNPLPEQSEQILNDVLELCRPLSTRDLEITATAFFIDRQQKVLFGCHDQNIVIEKVTHAKGNRFSENEINASYQRVLQKWLPLVKKYAVKQ